MTKHTPGPWVVHESGGFCYIRPADHEPGVMAVAQICKRPNYEQKPNARLISAAPEMLAALTKCLKHLEANPSLYKVSKTGEWVPLVFECQAAIAKAKGE